MLYLFLRRKLDCERTLKAREQASEETRNRYRPRQPASTTSKKRCYCTGTSHKETQTFRPETENTHKHTAVAAHVEGRATEGRSAH